MSGYREIFQQFPDDYLEWSNYVKESEARDDLSAADKERLRRAFEVLREELGEDFLKKAFIDKSNKNKERKRKKAHPIGLRLLNRTPSQLKWLMRFSEALSLLKKEAGNYSSLLQRLKVPTKYLEALSILDVALKLHNNSFSIHFEPEVWIEHRKKKPDIKARLAETNEEVYVEVTQIQESREERRLKELEKKLIQKIIRRPPNICLCIVMHRLLSKPTLEEILRELEVKINSVYERKEFEIFSIPYKLDIAIAHPSKKAEFHRWQLMNNLKEDTVVAAPPILKDPIRRISLRLQKKDGRDQLPRNKRNVMVIYYPGLIWPQNESERGRFVSSLEEEVFEYEYLHLLILGRNVTLQDSKQHLIIRNKYCTVPMSEKCLEAFCRSFSEQEIFQGDSPKKR